MVEETIDLRGGPLAELREFMGEMREFKRQTLARLSSIERRSGACQSDPNECATARKLSEHLGMRERASSFRLSAAAAFVAAIACAAHIASLAAKTGARL